MIYPNGLRVAPGWNTCRYYGQPWLMPYNGARAERLGIYTSDGMSTKQSVPEGAFPGFAWTPPIDAGGMGGTTRIDVEGSGNLLQGGPMVGTGAFGFTATDGSLSMIISMSGTGAVVTFSAGGNVLKLTIGMAGDGTWTLSGDGSSLAMIVPFDGSGSMSLTGTADLRGLLSLIGEWTPYTELSPENLANAVWEHVDGELVKKMLAAKVTKLGDVITIYENDGVTVFRQYNLAGGGRVQI